jgi:AcrR family transcriptional regulator
MNMFTKGRRESKKEATRKRILEVSLRLFQKQGFARTTMRDVARKAGIALGTTYNYFPTKEHIAGYFFERALGRVMERYRREEPRDASLEEKLFLLVSLELDEIAPYEEFLNLIVTHAVVPTSRLHPASVESQRLKMRYLEFVGGLVAAARERGELADLGFDGMILQAFWVYHLGIMMFWLNDASRKKEDTYVLLDKSLRFILGAMRGRPERPRRRR